MKRKIIIFGMLTLMVSLGAQAYTNVDGFYGETWLDHVDEDGFENFGSGTESAPWQIRSAGALAYLARAVNNGETYEGKYFVIAANIDLGYKPSGSKLVWVPIGCTNSPTSSGASVFKGTLTNGTDADGNPFTISGMTIRAYGTGTTSCFGLFGALRGTVDGLVLKNSDIFVDQTTEEYYAGAVCGYVGVSTPATISTRMGTIRNCIAEQTTIEAESSNTGTAIGGLVGIATLDISEVKANLAKSTMRLTGLMNAGGVAGETWWELMDCHAVVNMTVTNTSTDACYVGGVIGQTRSSSKSLSYYNSLKCCTSSGEIRGNGGQITMGGVIGIANWFLMMDYCTTCVSLSGGHTEGGLIGHCYSRDGSNGMMVDGCYSSSYVDGSLSTYAGGLFGCVEFYYNPSNYTITPLDNLRFSNFAGTMKKPENSNYYGSIVGYAKNYKSNAPMKFGYFRRDYRQCNLQTNSNGWVDDGDDLALATYFSPHPVNGDFRYDNNACMPETHMVSQLNSHLFFLDNVTLASIPFNVTGDVKCFYDVWDTTIDFYIGTFKNKSTAEPVATFTLPTPPACVEVDESQNIVRVLDPGEADVYVNYNGLQRKVHLNITYGQPWDGTRISWYNYNDYFAGGDGTEKNPYVIHNIPEFLLVMSSYNYANEEYRYNKAGNHFILANDLFFNNHLLGEDEQPKDDSREFYPKPLYGTLHGNGKTIYGMKCLKALSDTDGSGLGGLFTRVSGKVEDLAVVDAYVKSSGSGPGISAGIICGELLEGGSIERCLAHGNVQSNGYAGGICGYAESTGTRIADCFAAVHLGWPTGDPENYIGAGTVGATPAEVVRCVSIGKMEHNSEEYGLTQDGSKCTDCWFDRQMLSQDNTSTGSTYTKNMISGQILANASAWQNEEGRYPMLKQFASTNYGDLLSMPVLFADGDRTGNITQIFDFPTANVRWWAKSGDTYLDIINECGAGAPNGQTGDFTEHLLSENVTSKSACTKAMRAIAVNVRADKAGIKFEDTHAEAAAIRAFDASGDGLVTLREAFEADAAKFQTFNQNAAGTETFNEMRYFAGITTLQEDMISGLDDLREIQLPPSLTTVATNAFNGCVSLEEVELPVKFQTLEEGGFYGSGIKNILVAKRNPNCQSIAGVLYKNDPLDDLKVMLMAYPPGRGEADATLSVPLSKILPYAIYQVPALRNVYIDNCLPEGEMAVLQDDGIIHEDPTDLIHVYVNDGSFNSQLFQDYYNDVDWGELYYDEDHLDIYYPLTVASALWATLYIDFPTQLPEGLKAYIADVPNEAEKKVVLHSIGRIIPRSTPVAIKAEEPGLYPLYKYEGTIPNVNKWENRFVGSFIGQDGLWGVPVNQETAEEGSMLTLGRNKDGVVGFFKYTGSEIPPYRAYLTRNNVSDRQAHYAIVIGDDIDTTDAIRSYESGAESPSAIYDISGRRVGQGVKETELQGNLPKGIYIVNGKKIVVR